MQQLKHDVKDNEDVASNPYDWERLRQELLSLNPQFTVLTAVMPREPFYGCLSSVTSSLYPMRYTTLFKEDLT